MSAPESVAVRAVVRKSVRRQLTSRDESICDEASSGRRRFRAMSGSRGEARLIAAVLACGTCIVATRHRFGIPIDGQAYLGTARNLLAGRGLTTPFDVFTSGLSPARQVSFRGAIPLTHFPPLYPLAIAGTAKLGLSTVTAARLLNAVLLGGNLWLVGLTALRLTCRRAVGLAVAMMTLVVAAPVAPDAFGVHVNWLYLHAYAFSEPLFFTFTLGALLLLSRGLADMSPRMLGAAAWCAAGAFLTRFAGIAVVATVVAGVLWWATESRHQRLLRAMRVGLVGIAPAALVSVYTSGALHGESAREFAVHGYGWTLGTLLNLMSNWFLPDSIAPVAREAILGVVFAGLGVAWARLDVSGRYPHHGRETQMLVRSLLLFAACYLAVVIFSRDFLDISIPLDNRLLSPLQPVAYLLALAVAFPLTARALNKRRFRPASILTIVVLMVGAIGIVPAIRFIADGPPALPQDDQTTLDAVRQLPRGTLIAAVLAGVVSQYTGKDTIRLPNRLNGLTDAPNPNFERDVQQVADLLARHSGRVLVFPGQISGSFATPDDVARYLPLAVVATFPNGGELLATASSHPTPGVKTDSPGGG
jgi:hypothetical protein